MLYFIMITKKGARALAHTALKRGRLNPPPITNLLHITYLRRITPPPYELPSTEAISDCMIPALTTFWMSTVPKILEEHFRRKILL